MARFYFHLHECGTLIADDEGLECADLAAVRRTALKAARDVMCGEVEQGRLCLSCRVEVLDGAGAAVLDLPFRDAIAVTGL